MEYNIRGIIRGVPKIKGQYQTETAATRGLQQDIDVRPFATNLRHPSPSTALAILTRRF
jgi:hypothetical protein